MRTFKNNTLTDLFTNIAKVVFFSFLAFCLINILIHVFASPGSISFGSF